MRVAGRALALVILAGFVGEQVTYALRGEWSAEVNLPFQLSDAVTLVAVAALWRPQAQLRVELLYFWVLTASLQAVITPDLRQEFPDVLFFTYYATHCGAILGACLLVFGAGRVPRPGAWKRVYAITLAFAAAAAVATLVDVMGPWPVYIVAAAVLGFVLFWAVAALARATRVPPCA